MSAQQHSLPWVSDSLQVQNFFFSLQVPIASHGSVVISIRSVKKKKKVQNKIYFDIKWFCDFLCVWIVFRVFFVCVSSHTGTNAVEQVSIFLGVSDNVNAFNNALCNTLSTKQDTP